MLFDDFFNDKNGDADFNEFLKRLLKMSDSIKKDDKSGLSEQLSVEIFKEDGYTFEKTVWKTEDGLITKIEMVGTPFEEIGKQTTLNVVPLEVQLTKAIEEERYEDAAKIRDEIENSSINKVATSTDGKNDQWNF